MSQHGHSLPAKTLHDLIRHRFRQDSRVDRPLPFTAITSALTSANRYLTLLRDATDGERTALAQVIDILTSTRDDLASKLDRAEYRAAHPRPVKKRDTYFLRHVRDVADAAQQRPPEEGPGALGPPRPLSQLSGRRRVVPQLVTTSVGSIPMLRYKIGRPPPWLRRIVRQKQRENLKGVHRSENLEIVGDMGLWEDAWEREVGSLARRGVKEGLLELDAHFDTRLGPEESYSYWPFRVRQEAYHIFDRRRWWYAYRGWRLWQKVKREKWLAERETIPERLAKCVKQAQVLQRDVVRLGRRMEISGDFAVRDDAQAQEMMVELEALGPLEVPVEWSVKAMDRDLPTYLKAAAKELSIDWRAAEADHEAESLLDFFGSVGSRPADDQEQVVLR